MFGSLFPSTKQAKLAGEFRQPVTEVVGITPDGRWEQFGQGGYQTSLGESPTRWAQQK